MSFPDSSELEAGMELATTPEGFSSVAAKVEEKDFPISPPLELGLQSPSPFLTQLHFSASAVAQLFHELARLDPRDQKAPARRSSGRKGSDSAPGGDRDPNSTADEELLNIRGLGRGNPFLENIPDEALRRLNSWFPDLLPKALEIVDQFQEFVTKQNSQSRSSSSKESSSSSSSSDGFSAGLQSRFHSGGPDQGHSPSEKGDSDWFRAPIHRVVCRQNPEEHFYSIKGSAPFPYITTLAHCSCQALHNSVLRSDQALLCKHVSCLFSPVCVCVCVCVVFTSLVLLSLPNLTATRGTDRGSLSPGQTAGADPGREAVHPAPSCGSELAAI